MNPKKIGVIVAVVAAVGGGIWAFKCNVSCGRAGSHSRAHTENKGILRAGAAAGTPTVTFTVGNLCLPTKSQKGNLLLSVKAAPTSCADGMRCHGFEQFIPVARDAFRSPAWQESLSLDVDAVAASLSTTVENLTVAVSLCEDVNSNAKCDEIPLQQVARFNGRYLHQMENTQPFSMQFVSDRNSRCKG